MRNTEENTTGTLTTIMSQKQKLTETKYFDLDEVNDKLKNLSCPPHIISTARITLHCHQNFMRSSGNEHIEKEKYASCLC